MSEEAAEWWQLQRAAGTLAEAFLDDPVMCFLFAEPAVEKRALLMQAYFAAKLAASGGNKTIKILIPKTNASRHSPAAMAAAYWEAPPPLQPPPSAPALSAAKYTKLSGAVVMGALGDASAGSAAAGRLHALRTLKAERPTAKRHWYLQFIGTRAAGRRKGHASALIRAVTDQCDAEGIGAYLESSDVKNVPLYTQHGFRILKTVTLRGKGGDAALGSPDLEVRVPIMWRDPQPPSTAATQQQLAAKL